MNVFSPARFPAKLLESCRKGSLLHARPHLGPQRVDGLEALDALRWEPSRGGDLFPHLYSPLPVAAVGEARPMTVDADGTMRVGDPA